MLGNRTPPRLTEFDKQAFDIFVPDDHYLRKAMAAIDWDSFHEVLAPYYSADQGRPSDPPVMLLKLEFLRYQYNLSDRQVIARAKTDLSFRYFLQVDHYHCLVDPSLLCLFRGRLGRDGFRKVFNQLVGMAREHGLVKDRLRIKDASHVIANIAIPATLGLVSQVRDKLLAAAAAFEPVRVEGERVNLELLRQRTEGSNNEQRLLARVTHLREILSWVDELLPPEGDANRDWKRLVAQRQVAHKILADQENPQAGDRTLSTVDPEARRGKHGDWFDGYMVDILMDADSDLITQINVLPAGGNEAQDAIELIRREEDAHGNDIEALSIDGAGFNGPMLREVEDPEGLNVNLFVPVPKEAATKVFTPGDFVEDSEEGCVTCPAGNKSRSRRRNRKDTSWVYQFTRSTCQGCPLLESCMGHLPEHNGRSVHKNGYELEYRRAREKTKTSEYAAVRTEHPKVERKLGEMLNRHGARRARYHGLEKVMIQQLMAGLATNVKRILHLESAPTSRVQPAM